MRQIVFTLCSNNYLAQAKTLGDSLIRHNPNYHFVIGLVDKFDSKIDYDFFSPYELIEIDQIEIPDFQNLVEKFNVIELNTSVKPFMFLYLFERYSACNTIMYFDPDILVLNNLNYVEEKLANNNIIITPHIWSPIGIDSLSHGENIFLKYGIYNLGFIGLSKTNETFRFLNWWKERTYNLGFDNVAQGVFVDQKWINLVPLFFKNVYIAEHLGLNVAFWNLHERRIEKKQDGFFVNGEFDLVFYHFSQFNPNNDVLASKHNRYSFDNRRDLVALFSIYKNALLANKYNYFKSFICHFVSIRDNKSRDYLERRGKRPRFSLLFKLIKNFMPISKAHSLKEYMDYLISLKTVQKDDPKDG